MGGFTSEIKVGLMTVVGIVVLMYFLLNSRDAPFGLGQSYAIWTTVPSAEGIQFGSQVTMAGVKVGRVGQILLTPEGKARVELELDKNVQLPQDSKVTVKSMGLLGDRSVHLMPGAQDATVQPGGEVVYTTGESDLDELTKKMAGVADEVQGITRDLKSISGSVNETVSGGAITLPLENILKNLETVSATIKDVGQGSQGNVDTILQNIESITRSLNELVKTSQDVVQASGSSVQDKIGAVDGIVEEVNKTIGSLQTLVDKLNRGEGTVGALLNDRATIDSLNQTLTTAGALVDKVNRFKATVDIRGDYYALSAPGLQGQMKNTLGLTLAGRKDYYYLIELVSDPVMDYSVEGVEYWSGADLIASSTQHVFSDAYQFSFQFARRFKDLALRIGLKENHGGVGADYFFLQDRIGLSADLYDFPTRALPNLELRARVGLYNHAYLTAGLDDVLNRGAQGGVNLYLGAGISFQDDDLKYILSVLPMP